MFRDNRKFLVRLFVFKRKSEIWGVIGGAKGHHTTTTKNTYKGHSQRQKGTKENYNVITQYVSN